MQHEKAVSLKADSRHTTRRSLRRVRIASVPAILGTLLFLSEAARQVDGASSCSVLFQSLRDAYKPRLAFQHAVIPLGRALGPRREDALHREHHSCPWVACGSKGTAARWRVAPWILGDSGRQEGVFGMRAVGEVGNVDVDNSNSSSHSNTQDDDNVEDHGDVGGAAVEGEVAVAEGPGVTEDTSAISTQSERAGQFGTTT